MKEITDILFLETGEGGDLSLQNNDIVTTDSIINSIYIALFGGNIEQNTTNDIDAGVERSDWFGNALGLDYNSNFERTLLEVALNSAGISKLENSAKEDLKYLNDIVEYTVNITIDSIDRMTLIVSLQNVKVKYIFDQLKKEITQEIEI